ncbi:uncharacterized protein SOCE836_084970 [Sorangium cellulosum]|uniref:Uncharacterized protein n=1 Tax=Sorangium cellulosum TaxID=56 RepID=A0A4P2R062_SORCE|nr:uncharacterized protein SOCE836_084970 [Sorangium cellulosum]WCQ95590.1 hypothetical protein NQZ70_08367 [Sorangium sp. Soce836]
MPSRFGNAPGSTRREDRPCPHVPICPPPARPGQASADVPTRPMLRPLQRSVARHPLASSRASSPRGCRAERRRDLPRLPVQVVRDPHREARRIPAEAPVLERISAEPRRELRRSAPPHPRAPPAPPRRTAAPRGSPPPRRRRPPDRGALRSSSLRQGCTTTAMRRRRPTSIDRCASAISAPSTRTTRTRSPSRWRAPATLAISARSERSQMYLRARGGTTRRGRRPCRRRHRSCGGVPMCQ